MRFIHAADLHLDSPLAGLRERAGERADDLAGASRRAFENLLDAAIRERVDLVVVAGDVFDGDWGDYTSGLFLLKGLDRLRRAGIRVALIRGNHDAANQMSRRLTWPDNVHEFSSRHAETRIYEDLGIAVHGQSFANRAVPENLAASYPSARAGLFNIGVLHSSLTGRPGHEPYAPCELRDLLLKGYDYWALGHVHTREVLCRDPWVVFPGNLQARHVNEPGPKGFTLVQVDGGRVTSAEPVHVDVVRFARIEVDVSDTCDFEDLCPRVGAAIDTALAEADGRTLAVRLVLTGACAAHRLLAGEPDRLEAECASLALQARGDVWIERVDVETASPAAGTAATGLSDLARFIDNVRSDAAHSGDIRALLQKGIGKVPPGLRGEIGLDEVSDALCERVLADAEALLLHRLHTGTVRA